MVDDKDNLGVFNFGEFTFDAEERELTRNGNPIPITPRVLDTLLAFLRRPGETLTKRELMRTIWPDSFVEESNLIQNVAVLCKALGDDPKESRFIATVPGRGYRFVASVVRGDAHDEVIHLGSATQPATGQREIKSPGFWWAIAGVVAVSVAVATFGYYSFYVRSPAPPKIGHAEQVTSSSSRERCT
jgi:DNA-binding winged helix-turn-helix (wHTH) protein